MADKNSHLVGLHQGEEVGLILALSASDAAAIGCCCRSDDAFSPALVLLLRVLGCRGGEDSGEGDDEDCDCKLVHVVGAAFDD